MPSTRDHISAELRKLIVEKQRSVMRRQPPPLFTDEASFSDDLGFDSIDMVEFVVALEDAFDVEVSDDEAEGLKTVGSAIDFLVTKLGAADGAWTKARTDAADELLFQGPSEFDEERCIACDVPLKDGDLVLNDESGGAIHTACCGPEREGYVNARGEPLGPDDPIPEGYRWSKWPGAAEAVEA